VFPFAFDDSDGLLKDAHEETFLLDEIEHLPHHLQRLVIKAFDEKHYRPADSPKAIDSEFRLLVTTSIPPDHLYQKIDSRFLDSMGAIIKMPPLADYSIDDKRSVWRHMFDLARRTVLGEEYEQVPGSALSADDEQQLIDVLDKHSLHGNFRDVKRLAFHVALALKFRKTRPDSREAFSPDRRIRDALDWTGYEPSEFSRPSVNLARAFAQGIPLDKALDTGLLKNASELVDGFTEEVRRFIGKEVRRIAKARRVRLEDVCEVPGPPGIAKWIKGRGKREDDETEPIDE
jgi:transcriptional regulator with AAA-type ATPase domain